MDFPFQRGYAAIGLLRPKTASNVGGAMRAAFCYGAGLVLVEGARNDAITHATNTLHGHKHVPTIVVDSLRGSIPFDCVPVAVDLIEVAVPLPSYQHPPRALYVFGPEDGTLGRSTLDWCRDRVAVPTRGCMNLAACVNVVLYDRLQKAMRAARKSEALGTMYGSSRRAAE